MDRYSQDYLEMQQKQNVKFYKTPDSILQRQLTAYDAAAAKKRKDNALCQGDRDLAEALRRARGEVGPRHQRATAAWPTTTTSARPAARSPRRRRPEPRSRCSRRHPG